MKVNGQGAGVPGYIVGLAMLLVPGYCASLEGTVVWYLEHENGNEAYKVRYIVTPEYMRSDEGGDGEGYVLLVRKDKQIYNVVPENRSVLQIDGVGKLVPAPAEQGVEVKETRDSQAPTLEGKPALSLELYAGSDLCDSSVVVPGLLEDVRQALSEFRLALAVQQSRTIGNTPEEFRTPCFMANSIYAADYHLQRGIPLLEWRENKQSSKLLDYEAGVELPGALFELPQDYRYFRAPEN